MKTPMTVRQRISQAIADTPEDTADDIAGRVLADCLKSDLLPLVVDAVQLAQRSMVRQVEVEAFAQIRRRFHQSRSLPELGSPDGLVPSFRALFAQTFALGDGTVVEWGKATREQFQQRRAMLVKLRNGVDESIRFIDRSLEILEATGASCLEEADLAA